MSSKPENAIIEQEVNSELDTKNDDGGTISNDDLKSTQPYDDDDDELELNDLSQRSLLNIDESAKSQSDLFQKIYESTNKVLNLKICYKLEDLVNKSMLLFYYSFLNKLAL
jgi:hypothetical protein